jgi:hypothetical protein
MRIARSSRLLFALAALLTAWSAAAHEIGTTRVRAELRKDHTYRIDVITAPRALLDKLHGRARLPLTRSDNPNVLRAGLLRFLPVLQRAADIRFGERPSAPRVSVLPIVVSRDPSVPTHVVLRYEGEVPNRAGAFTWSWDLVYSTYALSIHTPLTEPRQQWVEASDRSEPFAVDASIAAPTTLDTVRQYLTLGFTHIVPLGLDHILFVIGMFLLTPRVKPVLTQVTAFTIAHTITLALTMYGLISVSPRIVEPLIALSIAYVAVENLTTTHLRRSRVAIVFAFGLLHGMGFAGVLKELGLPRSQAAFALVSFNVGVELGQLSVILVVYAVIVSWAKQRPWFRQRFVVPASLAIAVMGMIWLIERVVA